MPLSGTGRHVLLVLVAAAASLYLLLLLTNAYRSQGQLYAAAEARLRAESEQTATLIGDFLVEQESFAVDLAQIHEIDTFLVNKALGMSMRYGLNVNLSAVRESFRHKLEQKRLLGAPVYTRILYALTAEIARRKILERQLRESEERYRTCIEHAPEGIFVTDSEGGLVDVNPSACAMVGYSRAELLTMALADLSPPDPAGRQPDVIQQVLVNGPLEREISLCRKDGTGIIGSLRAIALPDHLVLGFCV